MAVVVINLKPSDAFAVPGILFPQYELAFSDGAGLPPVQANLNLAMPLPALKYTRGVTSSAYWFFGTGAIGAVPAVTVSFDWYSSNSNAGTFAWNMRMFPVTFSNTVPMPNQFLFNQTTATPTVNTTLAGPNRTVFNVADANSLFVQSATGTAVGLKLSRSGATDVNPGDARLLNVVFAYQDT